MKRKHFLLFCCMVLSGWKTRDDTPRERDPDYLFPSLIQFATSTGDFNKLHYEEVDVERERNVKEVEKPLSLSHAPLVASRKLSHNQPINVLAIDGGGVKGIIPALFLKEIELRSGRQVADLFDLIVGTSAGGIIALGLTKAHPDSEEISHYSAEDIVNFYKSLSNEIFPPYKSFVHKYISKVPSTVWWGSEYSPDPLILKLKELMGDTPISAARIPIVITSVDAEKNKLRLFRSYRAISDPQENFLMRDAARATSAAPSYFPKAFVSAVNHPHVESLVDGGMAANNPAFIALCEAYRLYGNRPINLISLSTGQSLRINDIKEVPYVLRPAPIINMLFEAQSDTVDNVLTTMKDANPHIRYERLKVYLDEELQELDKAKNMRKLEQAAQIWIANQNEKINTIVKDLNEAKPISETEQLVINARKGKSS